MQWYKLIIRYPDHCTLCNKKFPAKSELWYERSTKKLKCDLCHNNEQIDISKKSEYESTAGNSAGREYEKRRKRYEDKVRKEHPIIGELILTIKDEPSHIKAWKKGQVGEQGVAAVIEKLGRDQKWKIYHDINIPGTKANIDHLVINASGLWVIDAKNYRGLVRQEGSGGLLQTKKERKLFVGKRDCTSLIEGVRWQVEKVRAAITVNTPVTGVLAFYQAEWPWVGKPLVINQVVINSKGLKQILNKPGEISNEQIEIIAAEIVKEFPSAKNSAERL